MKNYPLGTRREHARQLLKISVLYACIKNCTHLNIRLGRDCGAIVVLQVCNIGSYNVVTYDGGLRIKTKWPIRILSRPSGHTPFLADVIFRRKTSTRQNYNIVCVLYRIGFV